MTTLHIIEDLQEKIEVLGYDLIAVQVRRLKESYLEDIKRLRPKPKKAAIKKPKAKAQRFELILTESGVTSNIFFDTEPEADKFLKFKQKERKSKIDLWFKSTGNYPPEESNYAYRSREGYRKACAEHLENIKVAGLDFHVIIKRC